MAKTKTKQAPKGHETTISIAEEGLRIAAEKLRDAIAKSTAGRVGALARHLAPIAAECRKTEALNRRGLEALTAATVLLWFRRLDREERQQLVAEIEQIDTEGSALG